MLPFYVKERGSLKSHSIDILSAKSCPIEIESDFTSPLVLATPRRKNSLKSLFDSEAKTKLIILEFKKKIKN